MKMKKTVVHLLCFASVLIAGAIFSTQSHALTTTLTADELSNFLKGYRDSSDPRKHLLWTKLQETLTANGISLTESGITVADTAISDGQSSSVVSCDSLKDVFVLPATTMQIGSLNMYVPPRPSLPGVPPIGPVWATHQNIPWSVTLAGAETAISFGYEPGRLVFDAELLGNISASTTGTFDWNYGIWQINMVEVCDPIWGWPCATVPDPLGRGSWQCYHLANEHWSVDFDGLASAHLATSMTVSFDALTNILKVGIPDVSINAHLLPGVTVNATTTFQPHAALWSKIGMSLPSEIEDKINVKVQEAANNKAAAIAAQIQGQYTGEYDLSQILDPALLKLLGEVLNSPFLHDYIEQHAQELLFYMLIGDAEGLKQSFATTAACNSVATLATSSAIQPALLYAHIGAGGSCAQVNNPEGSTGPYFADSGCTSPIDFQPASLSAWCTESIGANFTTTLGNAAAWTPNANPPIPGVPSQKWTIPIGTQIPMTSEPIAGNTTPFMKRVDYRDVVVSSSPAATCKLEMRIYKKNVNATGLTPLMIIHGGSWQGRGAAFVNMEAQISHYTDDGFVVFAPFYRLAGTADGNVECNGAAWTDIVSDVEAALTWVQAHGATFGAKPGKISLMGQSAGAHLAGWLVTHRPNDVERALLLYPPTDVNDLVAHAQVGDTYEPFMANLGLLATYFGAPLASVPQDAKNQNSYRDLVASAGGQMPPVFLIHGVADTLVPSNQSVILCNAYGGSAVNTGGGTALRATYNCGEKGHLHLFEEAQHGLDACVTTRANGMCLAGSEASRSLVASSLHQARSWLKGDNFAWLVPIIDLILD